MTHRELWERINLTMECSPAVMDFDARGGFAWWENGMPIATPGVCVAMVGHKLDERFLVRGYRAYLLGWEWSYTMHFEMAINGLFKGSIADYNDTGYFPPLPYRAIPEITENNYESVLKPLFFCGKPCSPSDFHKEGKCAINGCYY